MDECVGVSADVVDGKLIRLRNQAGSLEGCSIDRVYKFYDTFLQVLEPVLSAPAPPRDVRASTIGRTKVDTSRKPSAPSPPEKLLRRDELSVLPARQPGFRMFLS